MVGEELVSVPLKSIAVDVRLHAVGARATLRAAFVNETAEVLETVFVYPLAGRGTVCDFRADLAGRMVEFPLDFRRIR